MSKFQLVNGSASSEIVTIQGNVSADLRLTEGGMCFIQVAWERAADLVDAKTGKKLPTFVSVKCWGLDAREAVALLKKGTRVEIQATRQPDTYPDNRSEELKARFKRDGYEYRLLAVKIIAKKAA